LATNNNLVYGQDPGQAARIRSGTFDLWLIVSASMDNVRECVWEPRK